MSIPLDYETLRVLWWALLGILLIGFAIFDGFDLGTAILLPFAGRTELERPQSALWRLTTATIESWRCGSC